MGVLSRYVRALSELVGFRWFISLRRLLGLRRKATEHDRPGQSERDTRRSPYPCVPINRPEFLRPDPLIYSQYFFMLHGLAVTWDNPDIVLQKDGKSVSSSALEPDTTYEVVARIWNASKLCPVVSMPVYFGFLSFGVGTKYTQIGKTYVDLGVKGGPDCPAFAKVQWKTPREAGHYCIQVFLAPPDDLNYLNNLGQENTQVVAAHSPATLTFQLRNDSPVDRRFHFEVDGYELPKLPPCPTGVEAQPVATNVPILMGQVDYKQEAFGRRAQPDESRIAGQRRGAVPLPLGWQVLIAPEHPVLKPEDEITVTVTANPPPGFAGEQRININAFTEEKPAGGVTMIVTAGH